MAKQCTFVGEKVINDRPARLGYNSNREVIATQITVLAR